MLKSPTSSTKSPVVSRRAWSPHQAVLRRRKKQDGDQSTLDDSFGVLNLADLHGTSSSGDNNNNSDSVEEEDYLMKSLNSLSSSASSVKKGSKRPSKYAGRRPSASTVYVKNSRPPIIPKITWERQPSNRKITISTTTTPTTISSNSSSSSRKSPKKPPPPPTTTTTTATATKIDEIPIEMQRKLYKITDPTLTIKEKVQLELEMMKGSPEEKRIFLKYKSQFDRKQFFSSRTHEEEQRQQKIKDDSLVERKKEDEFSKYLDRKHKQERKEARDVVKRDIKLQEDARRHTAEIVARDMTQIKEAALEALTVSVERNQREKQVQTQKDQKRIEDFRRNEGKDMCDAQRALKEATMEQKDTGKKSASKSKSSKSKSSKKSSKSKSKSSS